jgi:hypothetical protein
MLKQLRARIGTIAIPWTRNQSFISGPPRAASSRVRAKNGIRSMSSSRPTTFGVGWWTWTCLFHQ